MIDEKNKLVDSFRKVYSSATTTASDPKIPDNDYFKRRLGGFGAEYEFPKYIKKIDKDIEFLEGGQFISKKRDNDSIKEKNEFIYTTFDTIEAEKYIKIYSQVSKWESVTHCYYIKILLNNWTDEEFEIVDKKTRKVDKILKPQFEYYLFDKKELKFVKSKSNDFNVILDHFEKAEKKPSKFKLREAEKFEFLNDYELDELKKVYSTRYFMDYISRYIKKNLIDVDGFIIKSEKIMIVEIKEKFPIKNKIRPNEQNEWSYGWDTRRLLWYDYISKKLDLDVLYIIKQVASKEDRALLQWDAILLKEFLKGVSWSFSRGGGGGEDTLSVPYLHFDKLNNLLNKF